MKEKYRRLLEHIGGKPGDEQQWVSNLTEFYLNSSGLILAEYTQCVVATKQRPVRTRQVTAMSKDAV